MQQHLDCILKAMKSLKLLKEGDDIISFCVRKDLTVWNKESKQESARCTHETGLWVRILLQ